MWGQPAETSTMPRLLSSSFGGGRNGSVVGHFGTWDIADLVALLN